MEQTNCQCTQHDPVDNHAGLASWAVRTVYDTVYIVCGECFESEHMFYQKYELEKR